jgi:hypothetical protein
MPGPLISVLTTTRRTLYLADTLSALDDAGAVLYDRRVFVDGPAGEMYHLIPAGWGVETVSPLQPRGTRKALWTILHRAARLGVPALIHFEDDVRTTRNAVKAMAAIDVPPEFGALLFFSQRPLPETPGIHPHPEGLGLWGTQALKVPARSLAKFADEKTKPVNDYDYSGDVWLGEQLRAAFYVPTLVRHIGAETAIPAQRNLGITGRDAHRAGLQYAGDDFDATTLIGRMIP